MRDGSALPLAEGEGGVAWVIHEQEAATMMLDAFPSMEETEPGTLASEMGDCASSSDYTCSSTYEYMNGVVEFESKDFMSVKKEEDKYQYHRQDQFGDELWLLPSSSELEREHLDSRLGHSREYW